IYDPATGGYTLLASPLPAPVWGHTANRLSDGTVLIAGGTGDGGLPVAAAQLFDPATGAVTALDPLSTPRARHTATLLRDGRGAPGGPAGPRRGRVECLGRPRFRGPLRPDGWHRQPGGTAQRPAHAGQRRALARRHRARRRRPDDDERGP